MSYKYHRLYLGKDENGKRILIDEHRKIVEDYIGRKLSSNEIVHHKNGNKSDNRIENLQIMTLAEHTSLHFKGKKLSEELKIKISNALKHRKNKLRPKTNEEIINIVKKYKELKKYRKVDRHFGFSNGTTGNIIRGENYYDLQSIIQEELNK